MNTKDLQQALEDFRQHLAAKPKVAEIVEEEDESAGEYQAAEYIIFSFALDTYVRHLEETIVFNLKQKTLRLKYLEEKSALVLPEEAIAIAEESKVLREAIEQLEANKENPVDNLVKTGLQLLRRLDRELETFQNFMLDNLPTEAHKKMLLRAISRPARTAEGTSRRVLGLRTVLNRGGAKTQQAVFDTPKARKQIKEAIAASMLDNGDAALDLFAAMIVRNSLIRKWIDLAAETARPLKIEEFQTTRLINPIEKASAGTIDQTSKLMVQQAQQDGAQGADEVQKAQEARQETLVEVEQTATAAAKAALDRNAELDEPPTRSEVVGLATAAAVAAMSDPSNPQNIPETLKGLDDEQRAAALTDGRVAIFAGAGSGKSSTLVARVAHLVRDRKVNPSRILVTSFNAEAANNLKGKISSVVGGEAVQQMSVGTMHSLFRRFITEFGTATEKAAMGAGFVKDGSSVAYAVQRVWEDVYGSEVPPPRLKVALLNKARWSGNNVTPEAAKLDASTQEEIDSAKWYEMYEGMKGTIPGWKPPKASRAFEAFMAKNRSSVARLGDFTDMLKIFRDILERSPAIRAKVQGMFDAIIVDEAQDRNTVMAQVIDMMSEHVTDGSDGKSVWIVGDDKQCCHVDTKVSTPKGTCRAGDLKQGSYVRSYKNGEISAQVVDQVCPSDWTWGYEIATSSGKSLTVSPNHRIWVSEINPELEGHIVYLMYREDMGFRVGVTSNHRTRGGRRSCVSRMALENAEAIWFLDRLPDYEDSLLAETSYSLQYGIPTAVFNGQWRNLNQDRINSVFERFGQNGRKLLEERHLDPQLPHWTAYASSNGRRKRRVIQMLAHHSKGTLVSFEWMGDDLDSKLAGFTSVCPAKGENRRRLRRYFDSYRDGLDFAIQLKAKTGALLNRRLSLGGVEEPYQLIHASGVLVGMRVVVLGDGKVETEEVVSVKKVDGTFVDLGIKEASNFFGGGILSHNSINSFQGAKAEIFKDLYEKEGTKTRVIHTNYRSEPEIIDAANSLIAHNEGNVPIPQHAAPGRMYGVGSVRVDTPVDDADAALTVVEEIKQNQVMGENLTDHAILCRTNKELNAYETACIVRGVPYARRGAASFFGSPETKAVLGYVQLVTGTDFGKGQEALGNTINNPNRFFLSDPKKAPEAVKQAFQMYASALDVEAKTISPTKALKDPAFARILAGTLSRLTRTGKGFKFEERIQDLGYSLEEMQAQSKTPGYQTKDLFDDILSLKGTAIIDGTFTEQTFRASLQASIRNAVGDEVDTDEEEEEKETKGLGNVSFLYQLAQVDPTDEDDALNPPTTPLGFAAKMSRYASKMRDLRTDIDVWRKEQDKVSPEKREKSPPGVFIGTVHATKGNEWVTTFVQMPRGKFPIEFKAKPGDPEPDPVKEQEWIEDERRLGYVALTRAIKNLRIVCPTTIGGKSAGVSSYVGEAGLKVPIKAKEASEFLGSLREASTYEEASYEEEPITVSGYGSWDPFQG
jgi:superfamily I DNA/RNA helicase